MEKFRLVLDQSRRERHRGNLLKQSRDTGSHCRSSLPDDAVVGLQYSERSACHRYANMSKHTTIIVWAIEFASLTNSNHSAAVDCD